MAAVLISSANFDLNRTAVLSSSRTELSHFTPESRVRMCRFPNSSPLSSKENNIRRNDFKIRRALRHEPFSSSSLYPIVASSKEKSSFDVVIVGAGIIGLTIARQFLLGSDLSVAIVDAAVPCSGATGAGQGYIWMAHKTPGSDIWELGMRSKELWENLAESIEHQGLNPLEVLGWKKTGSLLIGRTSEELAILKGRVQKFSEAGLIANYLSADALLLKEPALEIEKEGGALFLPDDCQLDAQRTVAFIEKANRQFASNGRYAEFYYDPAICLVRSRSGSFGGVAAVKTSKNILYSKKAIIIAAGSWSGTLMHDLVQECNIALEIPVKPRKGHLLVVENCKSIQLNHGLMEVGYVGHQVVGSHPTTPPGLVEYEQSLSISMTATMDAMGNLVLGSSRQFAGFNTEVDESIIQRIWARAGDFFPALREVPLADITSKREVRIGLRPYMHDGKPIIGPVPGLPNVFLATGHEGSGLSLALGTAEMVADMVLGNPGKVDYAPFSIEGRCCS